jgi:hypothetical protein
MGYIVPDEIPDALEMSEPASPAMGAPMSCPRTLSVGLVMRGACVLIVESLYRGPTEVKKNCEPAQFRRVAPVRQQ